MKDEQLTPRTYSSLPWELRNHIHTFCVEGSYDNEVIVRRASGSKSALFVRQSIGAHAYQWIEDPVFRRLDPHRLELGIARELLEAYFWTHTFKVSHQDLDLVQTFLETDRFGLGVRPADHVRCLHVQIQPFMCAQLRLPKSKDEQLVRCRRALEGLATIQSPRTTVNIHVDLAQSFLDDEDSENLLADAAQLVLQVVEVVNILRTNGLKINLIFEGKWDGKDGMQLCSKSVSSLDDCISQMKTACQ